MDFDEIGYWTELKLEIIKEYAQEYSKVLSNQTNPSLYHIYIDGFSGAGQHISRTTRKPVEGSPLNALHVQPPFKEYHFIDLNRGKISALESSVGNRPDVFLYNEDCNWCLHNNVFPRVQYSDYRRGLCLLDPYGLHLDWEVVREAGQMKTLELFLNFPIMDMNRNILWTEPEKVSADEIERMNAYWGDASWRTAAYERTGNLFEWEEKTSHKVVVEKYIERLKSEAGFAYVAEPLLMRNRKRAPVYYLLFASPNPTGHKIVSHIFKKYEKRAG